MKLLKTMLIGAIIAFGLIAPAPADAPAPRDVAASTSSPEIMTVAVTTTVHYYSRSEVERLYKLVNNIGNVCNLLPTSWLAGVGCGAPAAFKDAVNRAHYESKRVKSVYYNCGYTYCSYYKYYVVA